MDFEEKIKYTKDVLISRQQAYQQTFVADGVFIKTVLADLASFCRAEQSAFHPDPRIHAVIEGRREVWLRIQDHLKLSPEEFLTKYVPAKENRK